MGCTTKLLFTDAELFGRANVAPRHQLALLVYALARRNQINFIPPATDYGIGTLFDDKTVIKNAAAIRPSMTENEFISGHIALANANALAGGLPTLSLSQALKDAKGLLSVDDGLLRVAALMLECQMLTT